MANQYAQLFQIVGKLQDQVNLCQKTGEPLVGPLNITGDIIATGDITGANLISTGDISGNSLSSLTTVTANGNIATGTGLVVAGNQVVGAQQPNVLNLLDNSGGTADGTIAVITQVANAGSADLVPTQNAIADLAAKVNAILTALKAHGLIEPDP